MLDPNTVSAAPFIADLKPYIDIIVPPIVTALIGAAVFYVQKWTGIQISSDAVDRLKSAAATQAGKIVAESETNLAGQSIKVGDPRIAAAANWIATNMPGYMQQAGATPDALKHIVQGELGKLQAQAIVAPADAALAPPPVRVASK